MAQLSIPKTQDAKTIQYADLLGVDYQSDATEVNRRRSPEMVNMISDLGGNPIKRYGYRRVGDRYLGFATAGGDEWGVRMSSGNVIAEKITINSTGVIVPDLVYTRTIGATSTIGNVNKVIGFQKYVYVMCDKAWVEVNTEDLSVAKIGVALGIGYNIVQGFIEPVMPDEKFIPTTMTLRNPDGTGVSLPEGSSATGATRGVNVLTPFMACEFFVTTSTADDTEFKIPAYKEISSASGTIKVQVLDKDTFEWDTVASSNYSTTTPIGTDCRRPDDSDDGMAKVCDAKITFTSTNILPYKKKTVDGVDHLVFRADESIEVPAEQPNVRIVFAPFSEKVYSTSRGGLQVITPCGFYSEERRDVLKSKVMSAYDSRIFVSCGVHTYYSRASEFFAIDDNLYFDVDNDVMAHAKTSGYLAVISEDTGHNTIYLASGSYNETLAMMVYSIKPSSTGVGAVSSKALGSINDEPLFLSSNGIYGITTNYLSEKYAINRSGKINRRLCKEANLQNAVGLNYNGYYYLSINNKMYVLDSRHRDTSKNGDSSYECFYFDNMPSVIDIFVLGRRMYFMDSDYTYTWNDDMPSLYYIDNAVYQNNKWEGTPVKAKWCSVVDGDGYPQYYKVLSKKGTMVTLTPQEQTSCEITLIRDGADEYYLGKFDGTKIKLSDVTEDAMTRKKIKKYKRLQFVIENNEAEPFGLTSIIKTTTLTNYAKR